MDVEGWACGDWISGWGSLCDGWSGGRYSRERTQRDLVLLLCQGPRVGKKKGGERKGAIIVIAVRATSRSTFSGLNQPQRLKHFSLFGEKLGQCLPICGGQIFHFVRKNSITFNSLKFYLGICTMLFGLYPPSFLSFTTITFGLMTNH